jgi:predicted RNA-binding protein associated with RNAse of E/G family
MGNLANGGRLMANGLKAIKMGFFDKKYDILH